MTQPQTSGAPSPGRAKLALFWSLLFIIFGVVPLLALEGAARAVIHFKYGVPGKSYGLWRYDETLGAQHQENAYNTNAETNDFGFRNHEDVIEPKPAGALRFIAYGGSTTYCYNLTNREAWPTLLEERLRKTHHPRDQVLNGGAILWAIGHIHARAKKDLPRLRPDFVILSTGINEEGNAAYMHGQGKDLKALVRAGKYGEFATNFDQSRWIKRNLALARVYDYAVKPRLDRLLSPSAASRPLVPAPAAAAAVDARPDPIVLENYQHVLKDLLALIRVHGGEPIFVIEPHVDESRSQVTSYSRAGAQVAAAMGVMVVDAQRGIDRYKGNPKDLFIDTGVHLTSQGAVLHAGYLFEEILPAVLKGRRGPGSLLAREK